MLSVISPNGMSPNKLGPTPVLGKDSDPEKVVVVVLVLMVGTTMGASRVTFTVYVLVVVPSSAVTSTVKVLTPSMRVVDALAVALVLATPLIVIEDSDLESVGVNVSAVIEFGTVTL